jgi:Peptidase_C39 like family
VNKRRRFEMIYKTDKINKILGLGLLMALIIMSSGIASADIMLNVPTFDQTDSRWASDPLGLGTCTETIGSSGCVVTSVAMVLKYYGIQTDPKDLNSFLKINAGYDNCKIY